MAAKQRLRIGRVLAALLGFVLLVPGAVKAQSAPAIPAAGPLTVDEAWSIVQGGRAYATAHGFRLSFVVVDAAGRRILETRMDGAAFGTLAFSEGKAYASAAAGGLNGAQLIERYRAEPWIWGNAAALAGNGPMLPGAGTFPVRRSGALIGAVAVSGAGPSDDDAAALAGLAVAHLSAP
jgi:glc operon protein GlcG